MTGNINSVGALQRPMVNPAQYWANSYLNTAFVDGDDGFMGMGPIGGEACMNSTNSIYGGNNMYGGLGGCGMPGFAGAGGGAELYNMSLEDQAKYQERLENYQIDKQVRLKHKINAAEFESGAADDAVTRQIAILQRKIKDNEQDSVMKEYNKLLTAVETKLINGGSIQQRGSKDQVKAYAEKLYLQSTGKSVVDDLAENGDSSFTHGLKQGALFGAGSLLTNNRNYEENISAITGEDESSTSKTWKTVGVGTSVGITGGLLLGALKFFKRARI